MRGATKLYVLGVLWSGLALMSSGWSSDRPTVQMGQVAPPVEVGEEMRGELRGLSSRMAILELHTEVPALLRHAEQLREAIAVTVIRAEELLTPVRQDFEALPPWPADPSELALMLARNKGEAPSGGTATPNAGAEFRVKLGGVLRKAGALQRHWQTDAAAFGGAVETLSQGIQALLGRVADLERGEPAGASSFGARLRGLSGRVEEIQRGLALAQAQATEAREDTAAVTRALGALMSSDFVILHPEGGDDSDAQQEATKLAGTCLTARQTLSDHLVALASAPIPAELQRTVGQLEQGLRDLAGPVAVLDAKFGAEISALREEQQA